MKHKHAELIKAWADGAEIQFKNRNDEWENATAPTWYEYTEYRIKLEPKPDYTTFLFCTENGWLEAPISCYIRNSKKALKLINDGKTGDIKSAEVIK